MDTLIHFLPEGAVATVGFVTYLYARRALKRRAASAQREFDRRLGEFEGARLRDLQIELQEEVAAQREFDRRLDEFRTQRDHDRMLAEIRDREELAREVERDRKLADLAAAEAEERLRFLLDEREGILDEVVRSGGTDGHTAELARIEERIVRVRGGR